MDSCFLSFNVFSLHKSLQHISTHVLSSVQHAAQEPLFSALLTSTFHWLDDQIVSDRPELFMQHCLSVSVCVCVVCVFNCTVPIIFTLHKRAGTHRSLFSATGCHCLFRLPRSVCRRASSSSAVNEGEFGSYLLIINHPETCQLKS